MYRLSEEALMGASKELHTFAVYCVTETIKDQLKEYFHEGYEHESKETLYTKVDLEKVYSLVTVRMRKQMVYSGIDPSTFIPKKLAQFMTLLNQEEEETPDIFIEYMLSKMIKKRTRKQSAITPVHIAEKLTELKRLLRTHAEETMDFEDEEEFNDYVGTYTSMLTDFKSLFGVDHPYLESCILWDTDYLFFEQWGFEEVIQNFSFGPVSFMASYGLEYMKNIFTSVGEQVPYCLYGVK